MKMLSLVSLYQPQVLFQIDFTKNIIEPKLIIFSAKELHSPDGDSTTAPPSQSSEQSEFKVNNKVEFQLNPLQINSDSPQEPNVKKIKKVLVLAVSSLNYCRSQLLELIFEFYLYFRFFLNWLRRNKNTSKICNSYWLHISNPWERSISGITQI